MNNKKISIGIVALLLIITLVPQVTFASWWNPFSWFNRKIPAPVVVPVSKDTANNKVSDSSEEIQKLQQQIDDLKKQQPNTSTTVKKKTTIENIEKKPASVTTPIVPQVIVTPTPPVYDVCKNIQGIQTVVPSGMYLDERSNCVVYVNVNDVIQQPQQQTNSPQNDDNLRQFNQKFSDLTQQISDIKTQYNIDMENAIRTFGPFADLVAPAKKLLIEANAKIDQINIKIRQLQIDYNQKFIQTWDSNPLPANYCSVSKPCNGVASA